MIMRCLVLGLCLALADCSSNPSTSPPQKDVAADLPFDASRPAEAAATAVERAPAADEARAAELARLDLQKPDSGDTGPGPFEGYGRNATGGAGGSVATVTSNADSGPGSLRDLVGAVTGPTVVRFQSNMTILLDAPLLLPSNLTIDGRARVVVIKHKGFIIDGKSNIILVNLAFQDCLAPEDAIIIENGSHDLVIDHCLFNNAGLQPTQTDEQISVVFGSHDITISFCKFEAHEKVLLFGNGDAPEAVDKQITVTLHHNHFNKTGRRHPYVRYGKVDMYNNYVQEWHLYQGLQLCGSGGIILPCSFGVRSSLNAQVLLEANFFEQHDLFLQTIGGHGAVVEQGGQIQAINNDRLESWVTIASTGPVFSRPYPATIEVVNGAWRLALPARTGNVL